jgi:hypothetical protein
MLQLAGASLNRHDRDPMRVTERRASALLAVHPRAPRPNEHRASPQTIFSLSHRGKSRRQILRAALLSWTSSGSRAHVFLDRSIPQTSGRVGRRCRSRGIARFSSPAGSSGLDKRRRFCDANAVTCQNSRELPQVARNFSARWSARYAPNIPAKRRHLGAERLDRTQEVAGSSPASSSPRSQTDRSSQQAVDPRAHVVVGDVAATDDEPE